MIGAALRWEKKELVLGARGERWGREMKRSKYRADQVVCIRGLDMPHGCAVLKSRIEKHVWKIVVEQNGLMEEREITEGEIRPLTKREHGPSGSGGRN